LAKTAVCFFTEGTDDFKILRRFASQLGLTALSSEMILPQLNRLVFSSGQNSSVRVGHSHGNSLHIGLTVITYVQKR